MKIDWKSLHSRIPKTFKIGRKTIKINWVESFPDKKQVGETDWNNLTIYLKTGETYKESVHTYFHECLHMFSDEFQIKLSEKQVQGLEKTLTFWITKGNIIK
jgi:hypothetical protein